jgi:hypothetical protein
MELSQLQLRCCTVLKNGIIRYGEYLQAARLTWYHAHSQQGNFVSGHQLERLASSFIAGGGVFTAAYENRHLASPPC